ncbi:MAG TPA: heavy-metal-associated domain-containing protein [Thermoanaerobaculia bacterium]|jgi:copper chaperone CopZ|nr:heavy-metal-associated domain-containing protein [Thermoanaerobaculia bacterium]
MRNLAKSVIAVLLLFGVEQAAATTSTTTLHVEGMTCGGCATAVKLVLQKTPGVTDAKVSYEEKRAVVSYESAKTTPAKIATAVADALSYKVTVVDGTGVRPASNTAAPVATTACAIPKSASVAAKAVPLATYRSTDLRAEFNRASDRVRVVALLSPTCGACEKGQRVVETVFSKYPNDPRLKGFVVWLPMLPTDSEQAAGAQAGSFVDARVAQQWDGERASGALLAKTLGLKSSAWDVYLLYGPGVRWTGDNPPAPTFWMHQLRAETGADQRVCLNPSVFVGKVANLLGTTKGGA